MEAVPIVYLCGTRGVIPLNTRLQETAAKYFRQDVKKITLNFETCQSSCGFVTVLQRLCRFLFEKTTQQSDFVTFLPLNSFGIFFY
jgi:hypothetical protein